MVEPVKEYSVRRFILLMMLIAGLFLGIGYPWYVTNFSGEALGKLEFYHRGGSWKPVDVQFDKKLSPVGLKVLLRVDAPSEKLSQTARFALKVRGPEGLSYREILEFSLKPVGDGAVNGTLQELWQYADALIYLGNEPYRIELEQIGKNPLSIKSAELYLIANIGSYDKKALPLGTVLMGIGGFGLLLSFFASRGKNRRTPKSRTKKLQWGRRNDGQEK